ncbi:MAG: MMPL family transporter, partial [Desulfobacterales bacterium]|nr:MMPL family transporter [Desulfobacterales bacterium]
IAGIILTIGMAVDANVIIFERIREELTLGRTPRAAIDAGYDRATLTILDANVTTLIAAVVLFQFGTGPIKGFAVTLSLGVIASLFTALVMSRLVFEYILRGRKIKTLSI